MREILFATFIILLLAFDCGAAQVTLKWNDNSDDETGFSIERRLRSEPVAAYAEISKTPANAISYVDTTVTAGVVYCYRVRAFNDNSVSPFTNEACLLTTPTGLVIVYTP